jgi:hypothetical protein
LHQQRVREENPSQLRAFTGGFVSSGLVRLIDVTRRVTWRWQNIVGSGRQLLRFDLELPCPFNGSFKVLASGFDSLAQIVFVFVHAKVDSIIWAADD